LLLAAVSTREIGLAISGMYGFIPFVSLFIRLFAFIQLHAMAAWLKTYHRIIGVSMSKLVFVAKISLTCKTQIFIVQA